MLKLSDAHSGVSEVVSPKQAQGQAQQSRSTGRGQPKTKKEKPSRPRTSAVEPRCRKHQEFLRPNQYHKNAKTKACCDHARINICRTLLATCFDIFRCCCLWYFAYNCPSGVRKFLASGLNLSYNVFSQNLAPFALETFVLYTFPTVGDFGGLSGTFGPHLSGALLSVI